MRFRIFILAFLSALGIMMISCGKEQLCDGAYYASYELIEADSGGGSAPELSLLIDGPDMKCWRVSLSYGGRTYFSSAVTGRKTLIGIPSTLLDRRSGICCLCLKVFDAEDGTVLLNEVVKVSVMMPDIPEVVRPGIDSVYVVMSDGRSRLVEGGLYFFTEGERGLVVVKPDVWDENLVLNAVSEPFAGRMALGSDDTATRGNGAFLVPFVADEEGFGKIDFSVSLDGETSDVSRIRWKIEAAKESEAVPDSLYIADVRLVSQSFDDWGVENGESVLFEEKQAGFVIITPSVRSDNVSLRMDVHSEEGRFALGPDESISLINGSFIIPFLAEMEGKGTVEFFVFLEDLESEPFLFNWEINKSDPEPEPVVRDSVYVGSVIVSSASYDDRPLYDGARITLPEKESGSFVVKPSEWHDGLKLNARCVAGNGITLDTAIEDAGSGVFIVSFVAESAGAGTVEFSFILGDIKSEPMAIHLEIIPVEEEKPVRDTLFIESIQVVSASYEGRYIEEGDAVSFQEGESGTFIVKPNVWDEDVTVSVRSVSDCEGFVLGADADVKCGNGAFIVPFSAESAGTGKAVFVVLKGDLVSEAFVVLWRIESAEVEPPVEEKKPTVQLLLPPLAFVDKEVSAIVSVSNVEAGRRFSITVFADGNAEFSSSYTYDGMPVSVVLGKDVRLGGGWHNLSVECVFEDGGEPVSSETVRIRVSKPDFKWVSEDGSLCQKTLDYGSVTEYKKLLVDLNCADSLVRKVTLVDRASGDSYSFAKGNGLSFFVGYKGRGKRGFELTAETNAGTYSWDLQAICRDVWTIEPYIDGKTLYGRFSGPGDRTPCKVELSLKLLLCAYIPYEEAVIRYDEYVVESRGQYVDIGYEQESRTFEAGMTAGNHDLWSGNISYGLSYGRKQAGKVSVRKNGSSRWVFNGGLWSKEYYTPTPVPHIDFFIVGKVSGGDEYISFRMGYDSLKRFLETEGFSFRYKEYWD